MKLVNCHHVRKRRGRPPRPPSEREGRRRRRLRTGDELLKMMMIARDQPNCDLEIEEFQERRTSFEPLPPSRLADWSTTTTTKTTTTVKSKTKSVLTTSGGKKFTIFNGLSLWFALLCLLTCGERPALWPHPGASGRGVVLVADADMNANRLYEDLMMTYNRLVKPTRNASEKLIVRLGLKLSQLMEVNLKNQMMTINLWLNQEWLDYKLSWDPSEYGGITEIDLPAEQIWLPDIVLYNSAEGHFAVSIMTKAKVSHDGYVRWKPPAIFRSSCQIDITHFPFDTQNCHLKFGSWTFGDLIDLRHVNETSAPRDTSPQPSDSSQANEPHNKQVNASLIRAETTTTSPPADSNSQLSLTIEMGTDLSEYYQNVEWDIMQASAKRNTIKYDCCPEVYYDITFHYKLRRKPLFYSVNLIVPCVGITFFSFLVFYLPSDSGEKVTLTISILVSLIFFLSVLIETIPSTSLVMPLLGKYLVFTMILINMSVCATVGVLNIHFRTPSTHSMSPWVKRWCMDILPKYLFMSIPQYKHNILPEQLIYAHNQAYATQAVALPVNEPSKLSVGSQINELAKQQQQTSRNNKTCRQDSAGPATNSNQINIGPHQANNNNQAASSRQTPQELDAAQLLAGGGGNSVAQLRTTTFLPHLQSEAARRLQMQRSRSSEKDNRSTSDNQPAGGGGNGNQLASDNRAGQQDSKQTTDALKLLSPTTSRTAATRREQSTRTKSNPIWRLFKSTANKHEDQSDTESQRLQQRHSQSSTTSSASMARNDYDEDEYQHHRHFQARASICSNNLWRIGPTRRCSLSVPINNYPTYYRPLAQLQQQRGSGGGGGGLMVNTISGASCLPAHYHTHDEFSELTTTTTTTSSSDETIKYRSGTAIERLVNQSTNLVQPKQLFRLDNQTNSMAMHEMRPMTSDGFISVGSQMQRGVNAIPPQRPITPVSCTKSSPSAQSQLPTPPPPLPPDFNEPPLVCRARTSQLQNRLPPVSSSSAAVAAASLQRPNMDLAKLIQMDLLERAHQDRESSSSATTTIQRQDYSAAAAASQHYYNQTAQALAGERATKQHQLGLGLATSQNSCLVNDVNLPMQMAPNQPTRANEPPLLMNPSNLEGDIYHNDAHLAVGQQHSMPRSHSTDHRLFRLAGRDQLGFGGNGALLTSALQSAQQQPRYQRFGLVDQLQQQQQQQQQQRQQANYKSMEHMSLQLQHQQSIGRQLGQAYIQRLQRQPAIYSMQQQHTRTMQPVSSRDNYSFAAAEHQLRQARFGELVGGPNQAPPMRFANEPTIDMLRRSKSQTSLNRRNQGGSGGGGGCSLAMDCRHNYQTDGSSSKRDFALATNQLYADSRYVHRPQSETRTRVGSASHCASGECCLRNPLAQNYQQLDKGFECEIVHCPSAGNGGRGLRTMPIGHTKPNGHIGNEESSCRCGGGGLKESIVTTSNRPKPATDQIPQLSLLKLINEVDKAIQNAMFIAQHIDNLDEFESVKENYKYIAMVCDRICLIVFLLAFVVGTVWIFSTAPWTYYLREMPIDLDKVRLHTLNLTGCDTLKDGCP